MNSIFFDKKMTLYIKGISLILMYILHFFCFPSWYIDGISFPKLVFMEKMQGHFQICIAGFAFLTGYFYFFNSNRTIRYSLKKILEIMVPYWTVFIFYWILSLITHTWEGELKDFFLEFFSIKLSVMTFCWYVLFYILSMLSLPILNKICRSLDNSTVSAILFSSLGILGPIALFYIITRYTDNHTIVSVLEKFQVYFPIIIIGYATAAVNLFERLDRIIASVPTLLAVPLLFFVIVIIFIEPDWLYASNTPGLIFSIARKLIRIFSIPLFIYGMIELLSLVQKAEMLKPLELLGKYSLLMWFSHCIFFGCSADVFQKILFWPENPLLVLIWGLLINFCIAYLFSIPVSKLLKG